MNSTLRFDDATVRRSVALDGEHPDVIVGDIADRPLPRSRIIVLANEKGGVGKSTVAFHLCVAFAEAGLRVAALDLDRRQQTLSHALGNREATGRRLGLSLPQIRHAVLNMQSGATLCQEINRIGPDSEVIIIDVAGHDSAIARRAIAIADTLVTPVNSSFVDLDLLGKFHPVSLELVGPGCFAVAVNEIREARLRQGLKGLDWVVLQNRLRRGTSRNQQRIETALRVLGNEHGFRIASGLSERVAYRELFLLGLTHLDLPRIPDLQRVRHDAHKEILAVLSELASLPDVQCEPASSQKTATEILAASVFCAKETHHGK